MCPPPHKAKLASKRSHPGRRGNALSVHGVTVEQALAAGLRVNPAEVRKLEAQE